MTELVIVGRSSSSFTRIARFFAHELEVAYTFRPLFDLMSLDPTAYGENPALKIPVLIDEQGPLFGSENICRELTRRARDRERVVLRGATNHRLVTNAEELVLHAMSTEVSLITSKFTGQTPGPKLTSSLEHCLRWLDEHLSEVRAQLPSDRALSFVEVATFCLVRHLPFREVMDVSPWKRLAAFCAEMDARSGARATEYRYDQPTS
jgi:glutathione S-transferase